MCSRIRCKLLIRLRKNKSPSWGYRAEVYVQDVFEVVEHRMTDLLYIGFLFILTNVFLRRCSSLQQRCQLICRGRWWSTVSGNSFLASGRWFPALFHCWLWSLCALESVAWILRKKSGPVQTNSSELFLKMLCQGKMSVLKWLEVTQA